MRVARKHIRWYCQSHPRASEFWATISRTDDAGLQRRQVAGFFGVLESIGQQATLAERAQASRQAELA